MQPNALFMRVAKFGDGRMWRTDASHEGWIGEVCEALQWEEYPEPVVILATNILRPGKQQPENARRFMPTPPEFVDACEEVAQNCRAYMRARRDKIDELRFSAKEAVNAVLALSPPPSEEIVCWLEENESDARKASALVRKLRARRRNTRAA